MKILLCALLFWLGCFIFEIVDHEAKSRRKAHRDKFPEAE